MYLFKNFSLKDIPTTPAALFSAYASFTAFVQLVRAMVEQILPKPLRLYIFNKLKDYFFPSRSSEDMTLVINLYSASRMTENQVYDAAEVYLATKVKPSDKLLLVSKTHDQKTISFANAKAATIIDTFEDIELKWSHICPVKRSDAVQNDNEPQKQCFMLRFGTKHKEKVMECYLPYVLAKAKDIKQEEKLLKIFSCGGNSSRSIGLEHPATFETMAMDPEQKKMVMDDLDRFVRRRDFYKRVGKAWKRGYLLYGPPGTGKSSLIAAMANHLKFDIYDLELSSISRNSDLRSVLLSTSNRSILVIEDIDCSVEAENRVVAEKFMGSRYNRPSQMKFTLSGLLNVIDGLWSCVGDERIIIFTTNHKDRLDPALLRPGRMDVHIHMSYCTPSGFRILASNYLGIHESNPHRLCGEIEGLIESTEVTPAQVAEELMQSDDADVALEGLVNFLKCKIQVDSKKTKDEGTKKAESFEEELEQLDNGTHPIFSKTSAAFYKDVI
ncbi:putative ATPase, AAA-type, core, AAA-type ATPase domain-containing protein [Rosa chinensis]|uniref:Putative ATPase, AAA-type, core, AAA-type ATPase domain-containing protein n=1 Tax=Rosa chinensis TaxID=74649 RepID=A0A2P6RM75_ROSCH|nr:AAA-ATPase At5g17760 [Rosa chinensis]PRQ47540.1 putative ATPase, AAA-type, core, AAA-type ATPase domain-containing protein [Rosa chinensis]